MAKTKTADKPQAPKKAKHKPAWEGREVLYPDAHTTILDGVGDNGLFTVEMAKELLGWQTEEDVGGKFEDNYFLKADRHKVQLKNNITNRPWYSSNTESLKQEMLFGRWAFNGEPIIITKRGLVANGQHQMIALVLAELERLANPKPWKKVWGENPVAIPKVVLFGVEDDDKILDTMDTGKPRSLADVLFRGPHFASFKASERGSIAKVCDGAVRVLWERTGAYRGTDAWSPRRTHGEMMEFLSRHPKLLDAVKHIWTEDDAVPVETPDGVKTVRRISSVVRAGTAAALLYLMGSAQTDREESGYATKQRETCLDWTLWDKACEYWTLVAGGDDCKGVRDAVASLHEQNDGAGASALQRAIIACRGWHKFMNEGEVTGYEALLSDEDPTDCGGVDLGPKSLAEVDTPDEPAGDDEEGEGLPDETDIDYAVGSKADPDGEVTEDGEPVPTEEEVEKGKKKVKAKAENQKDPKPTRKPKAEPAE